MSNEVLQTEYEERTYGDQRFRFHKLPYTTAIEVLAKYLPGLLPKIGDFKTNHEMRLILFKHVSIELAENSFLPLSTETLINQHITNIKTGMSIEKDMFFYNYDFFKDGTLSVFLGQLEEMAAGKCTEILMKLLGKSSQADGQPTAS